MTAQSEGRPGVCVGLIVGPGCGPDLPVRDGFDGTERAQADRRHGRERKYAVQTKLGAETKAGFERRVRELDLVAVVEHAAGTAIADGELGDETDAVRVGRGAHAHAPEIRFTVSGLAVQSGLRITVARPEPSALPEREHVVVARQAHAGVELE